MKIFPGDNKIDWVLAGEFKEPETAEHISDVLEHNFHIRTKVDGIYIYTARGRAPEAISFIEDYMTQMKIMKRNFDEFQKNNYDAYEEDSYDHTQNDEKSENSENPENDENDENDENENTQ